MSTPPKSPATGGNRREAQVSFLHVDYTANEGLTAFSRAMQSAGISTPDTIRAAGQIHRFAGEGGKRANCWYFLHLDGRPAGEFGSWRLGIKQSWRADGAPPDPVEQRRTPRMIEAEQRKRRIAVAHRREQAASKALAWWESSSTADPAHSYLTAKQVAPYGLRQSKGLLLVALRDLGGSLWNIQTIASDGTKRFQRGARITGLAAIVGNMEQGECLLICEGWATAATLHAESGAPVLASMDYRNLPPLAVAARDRRPDNDIIICGDDNRALGGNPDRPAGRHGGGECNQCATGAFEGCG